MDKRDRELGSDWNVDRLRRDSLGSSVVAGCELGGGDGVASREHVDDVLADAADRARDLENRLPAAAAARGVVTIQ